MCYEPARKMYVNGQQLDHLGINNMQPLAHATDVFLSCEVLDHYLFFNSRLKHRRQKRQKKPQVGYQIN